MIIANGTIEIKCKCTAGGINDSTGYPVRGGKAYCNPIPCQYLASSLNLQALTSAGGEHFTKVSYIVYIDMVPVPCKGEQIRLRDHRGDIVGEYSITQVEPLEAVDQIRIYV